MYISGREASDLFVGACPTLTALGYVSGRISVCGCASQDLSCLISLSLHTTRLQVSVFICCIDQPVRVVTSLLPHATGLEVSGVVWVVFLRSEL